MVQTLGCGPTVGSPQSSSASPSLARGRVVPPPPDGGAEELRRAKQLDHTKGLNERSNVVRQELIIPLEKAERQDTRKEED